ncbi:MAG: type II secretion system ATPase GspE [Planctomycetota bacterium]|nr:type II secretion system ATPase GspE [Planctomycetota bacterium]
MSIVEVLLEKGLIRPEHLEQASELQKREGLRLDRALVKLGFIDEQVLLNFMSEQLAIPLIDLARIDIDTDALRSLPAKLIFRKRIVPVARHNGSLTIATSDPFDLYAFDEVRLLTGLQVEPALATESEIDKLIKRHFGVGGDTIDQMVGADGTPMQAAGEHAKDLLEEAQEASVIRLVNEFFVEAINERASDIHIEPYENDLVIRYRIDGVLHEAAVSPQIRRFQNAIISRIKIMANLNIAEKRLPQDGRIGLTVGGRQFDFRVSVIPMIFGEGVVMRVLEKSTILYTLPQLGMDGEMFKVFQEMINRPHGIILVTGPTGSGKTTTLYASLQALVGSDVKVLTVEDPVEYHLKGVNQIEVQHKIGMTFARGLRAILRHDPDVVMIGEIRDKETAEAAIQAALTGHLVLSTLHTNDACSAATRLLDMGIEPFLVTSTLNAAMAQRLVRTICKECKEEYEPDRELFPADFELAPGRKLFRGRGCPKCRGTGYRGRAGIYELMVNNEAISEKIMTRASSYAIVQSAQQTAKLKLLREDGWDKVRLGVTTPEEVMRSTKA